MAPNIDAHGRLSELARWTGRNLLLYIGLFLVEILSVGILLDVSVGSGVRDLASTIVGAFFYFGAAVFPIAAAFTACHSVLLLLGLTHWPQRQRQLVCTLIILAATALAMATFWRMNRGWEYAAVLVAAAAGAWLGSIRRGEEVGAVEAVLLQTPVVVGGLSLGGLVTLAAYAWVDALAS